MDRRLLGFLDGHDPEGAEVLMSAYLAQLPGIGFLGPRSVEYHFGGRLILGSEISIMVNPNDAIAMERKEAESMVESLNKKEDHKKWKIVAQSVALADFAKYGSI